MQRRWGGVVVGQGSGAQKVCRVGLAPAPSGGSISFSAHANAPGYGEFQSEGGEGANMYRGETAKQWTFICYKRLIF